MQISSLRKTSGKPVFPAVHSMSAHHHRGMPAKMTLTRHELRRLVADMVD